MSEPNDQFKRAPRRKGDRGKRVSVSEETKQLYAEMMREREKRQEDAKHLPAAWPGRTR